MIVSHIGWKLRLLRPTHVIASETLNVATQTVPKPSFSQYNLTPFGGNIYFAVDGTI